MPATPASLTLRLMQAADATAVSHLMPDLGYQASPAEIARRFAASRPDDLLLVAERDGRIIGFCHATLTPYLASDGYGEILALVVQAKAQRQGIGKALLEAAASWVHAQGFARVRLGSGAHREDAHRFYEAQGFRKNRPGFNFERHAS